MLTEEYKSSLVSALTSIGVNTGDILYVSSDIRTLLFNFSERFNISKKADRNEALNDIVNIFQQVVGTDGTILFPAFSWDYCRGNGFNIKDTKGEVGTFSNWVLKNRDDFHRTRHPMYSFMVWGKDTERLCSMDNQDAWSHMSPFYYFQMEGAKQLLFNIEAYQGLTFGHYVEQEVGVPYRHPKYFFGTYTDENGVDEVRMYSMYVRDMDVEVKCDVHNNFLIEKGVARQTKWDDNTLTVVDLKNCYDILKDDMKNNNGANTLKFMTGSLEWRKKKMVPYEVKGISI